MCTLPLLAALIVVAGCASGAAWAQQPPKPSPQTSESEAERRAAMMNECDGAIRGSVCVGSKGTSFFGPDGKLVPKTPGCHRTYQGSMVCFPD